MNEWVFLLAVPFVLPPVFIYAPFYGVRFCRKIVLS